MKDSIVTVAVLVLGLTSGMVGADEHPPVKKINEPEKVNDPKTIAPVFATASLKVMKESWRNAKNARLVLSVDCPQVKWVTKAKEEVVINLKPIFWKGIDTKVTDRKILIDFDSSSQIPESKVMTLGGKRLNSAEIEKAFAKKRRVLLSLTGEEVDPFYRDFYKEDVLVIILARDEGMGDENLISQKGF